MVCALLFFAASVNYMDRQVIGLLKPTLQLQFGWTEVGYSNIVLAFQFAYGASLLFIGKLIDRLGTRVGFAMAVMFWSLSAMAHAAAGSVFQFAAARFSLGIGESGSFPASIKAVAEWFPKKERALATGIFNSGTNVGAIVTPLIVPWITLRFGWRMAFIVTGALGMVWIAAWLALYRRPEESKWVSAGELALIQSDPDASVTTALPWSIMLRSRQAWAVGLGKFFTDPIWIVYLFWMPDFLSRNLNLDLKGMALPLFVIYSGASVGSICGGWLSSSLLKRGWSLNASRKTAMLTCALAVTPIVARCADHERLDRRVPRGDCGGSTPRMVCEYLYAGIGHVSERSGGICRRLRDAAWRPQRDVLVQGCGIHPATHWFVYSGVYSGRIGLPCGTWFRAVAGTRLERADV